MNRPKENPEFQKKFMHALQEFREGRRKRNPLL